MRHSPASPSTGRTSTTSRKFRLYWIQSPTSRSPARSTLSSPTSASTTGARVTTRSTRLSPRRRRTGRTSMSTWLSALRQRLGQPGRLAERGGQVGGLPGEVGELPAEVAVGRGLLVDVPVQPEVLAEGEGAQVEVLLDQGQDLRLGD